MKKIIGLALAALLTSLLPAQSDDDFFSDDNDAVLRKAREKYEQRQEADAATLNEEYATELAPSARPSATPTPAAAPTASVDPDQARARELVSQSSGDQTNPGVDVDINVDVDVDSDGNVKVDVDTNVTINGSPSPSAATAPEPATALEPAATPAPPAPPAEPKKANELVVRTTGDPDEPDFKIEIVNRLAKSLKENRLLLIEFFGFGDIFKRKDAKKQVSPGAADTDRADLGYTPFVVSFVPGISFPFGGIRDTSLALGAIGSATRNVNGISASGVFDIINEDLFGVQAAGIFGVVGGKAKGIQASGIFNVAGGDVRGAQAAGIFNISGGDLLGIQGAGIFNLAGGVKGAQAAGIFNIAENVSGLQSAGIFNVSADIHGFQAAGLVNTARDVKGMQAAGILNIARTVRGTQIGLVNVSENLYGIPFGLVNYTKNGVKDLGFWHDDADNVYAFAANGTNNFYSLVFAGESREEWGVSTGTLAAGVGVGYRSKIGSLNLDVDVSAKHFFGNTVQAAYDQLNAGIYPDDPNWVYPFGSVTAFPMARVSVGLPMFKVFEVFGGMSFDVGIDGTYPVPRALQDGKSYSFNAFDTPVEIFPHFFWGVKL